MKNLMVATAFAAALTLSGAASAATTTLFEEDFSGDLAVAGGSVLNFSNFSQFGVSDGTVDLIADGGFGISCGASGACVDLDGSTTDSGFLSSTVLNFVAGINYTFNAVLSGNQRGFGPDTGVFGITGGVLVLEYTLGDSAAFQDFNFEFTVAADTTGSVFFLDLGNDNVGPVLDSVSVTADIAPIPLPASALMLIAGLGGLGVMRRRKKAA